MSPVVGNILTPSGFVHGLRFFYHTTLKRDRTTFSIPSPRQSGKLPFVLSREEVQRLLTHAATQTYRTMLMTAYASGARLSEVLHLRVPDIDSARMTIRVEQGKGGKDRYTVLSAHLLEALRRYWKDTRPSTWLFPSARGSHPMDPTALQRAYPSLVGFTPCGTPSRRTCSRRAWTSTPFSDCWGTGTSVRRRGTFN